MKKNISNAKIMARMSIVCAIYVVLTFITYPISYGELGIEFRISEILILLCFFNSEYIISLVVGCFIANLFGTIGIVDALFGSLATLISGICISKSKNIFIAGIFPIVINMIVIGLEIYYLYNIPILYAMLGVAIGEFIVVIVIGCPLFLVLQKRSDFNLIINNKRNN